MFFAFSDTVTRLRRQQVAHPYGGDSKLADWSDKKHPPTQQVIVGVAIGEATQSETSPTIGRTTVTGTAALYAQIDIDLLPGDRIRTEHGAVYDVVGYPMRYKNPFTGWKAGSQTLLKQVIG